MKNRDITLLTKIQLVKLRVFPVVMYRCKSWPIKKAECQRIDIWCWRRPLRFHWTARKSKQSILKEINPEYSLEGLMLKMNLPYFGHLRQTANSLEKNLDAGWDWGKEKKGLTENEMIGWHHWFSGYEFEQTLGNSEGQRNLVCFSSWVHRVRHDLATEQQQLLSYRLCMILYFLVWAFQFFKKLRISYLLPEILTVINFNFLIQCSLLHLCKREKGRRGKREWEIQNS